MNLIISFILKLIKYLNNFLFKLQCFLINKYLKNDPSSNPVSEKYRALQIDAPPIVEKQKLLDCNILLHEYLVKHGKPLKPIKRRSKHLPPAGTKCPICGASYEFISDNSGGRGQLACKVCNSTFYPDNSYLDKLILKCPHCSKPLQKKRDRKNFTVFKCHNKHCSFYIHNLTSMPKNEKDDFKKNPYKYKLHYYYRTFNIPFDSLKQTPENPSPVDLSRIRNPKYILGLALTYHVNYGLSLRKTASILWDIHQFKISHQTIANYASSASKVLRWFLDNYPYELSEDVAACGDETYVKVKGKKHYVFFLMDAVKKIITSYSIFAQRDGVSAIKALYSTLSKFEKLPKDFTFIFDGNPIYLLAQHYFAQNGISFDVKQVIGLTNDDEVSKEYRWLKQIIERLNRTFKASYNSKNGFNSFEKANDYMVLFASFYNFLRRHSSLNYNVPVIIPEIAEIDDMPSKWLKLLCLSYEHLESLQASA